MIVFSDGGFNEGATAEDTARFARTHGVPIHVVGIGDPAPLRNVRVADIRAPS
ncbi:MAG: VWA domain-containing protein, partial [Proteobacteria bacterium]|nr:VWA domain-containing protein [Pseudomonadota bacterium]